jgi:hypothetical protein
MTGFQHDVAGGDGNLVITSLRSPNFVHGVSGWQISKNGSAEFQDVILPGGTGVTVTFAATAPAGPAVGDLWYNTSAGLEVSQWNGSAWVAYQIGVGALASGIIYAGIVDSTEIDGAVFRAENSHGATIMTINKSSATWLLYADTGSATQGALIASGSNTAGTDEFNNHYLEGQGSYGSAFANAMIGGGVIFYTGSLAGGWIPQGELLIDSGGDLLIDFSNVTVTGNLAVDGTFTNSGDTGTGLPAGSPTGGPNSGTFAGHTHDFDGHTHPL